MNIAIVDDDKLFALKLEKLIVLNSKKFNIFVNVDCYYDGFEILDKYSQYHLVFLDIEMPVIDGITISEKLNELKKNNEHPFVVFITGKDNLVFKALKSYPYSFIRKSDIETDLVNCILKINEKLRFENNLFVIHSGRDDIILNMLDIIYLEKQKNYVIYHTLSQSFAVRSNIEIEFEKLNKNNFIKPHIGYVVNNEYISGFFSDRIILRNSVTIPISKKYKNVRENYFKWLGDKYV